MKTFKISGVKFTKGYYCDTCSKDVSIVKALFHKILTHKILEITLFEFEDKKFEAVLVK